MTIKIQINSMWIHAVSECTKYQILVFSIQIWWDSPLWWLIPGANYFALEEESKIRCVNFRASVRCCITILVLKVLIAKFKFIYFCWTSIHQVFLLLLFAFLCIFCNNLSTDWMLLLFLVVFWFICECIGT